MAEEAKNGKKDNIWHKYKRLIISITSIFVVGYVVIYILFAKGFILDPGAELKKKDWLAFSSGYLSFVASLIVGIVAIYQNRFFCRGGEKTTRKEHTAYFVGESNNGYGE